MTPRSRSLVAFTPVAPSLRGAWALLALLLVAWAPAAAAPPDAAAPSAPGAARPVAPRLADLAFLAGTWRGEVGADRVEEHFTAPAGGTIVGLFRWITDDATTLTEHIVIEEGPEATTLRLRHFGPGLEPWERETREGPLTMRLAEAGPGLARFEAPEALFPRIATYRLATPVRMEVLLEGARADGTERRLALTFQRSTAMTTSTESLNDAGRALGYDGGLTLALSVSDLDRGIAFYRDVVGFNLVYRLDEMGWCEFTTSVPGVNVGLGVVESPQPGSQTPTFGVRDIEHARRELEARGAIFDGETVEIPGLVRLATFHDPDGNPIKLYQSLEGG